jgi:glycosyltransferase involved in cell wall biosynthesis
MVILSIHGHCGCGISERYRGADTELWHVLRLWRGFDVVATLIPTWYAPLGWRDRCDDLGMRTLQVGSSRDLSAIVRVSGSLVVSFCNAEFFKFSETLRDLGCRLVWVSCMTQLSHAELAYYESGGRFDAFVFQGDYQRSRLWPELNHFGFSERQCFSIRGALDVSDFPFQPRPRRPGDRFVVGKLARPDLDKWSRNYWSILARIRADNVRARVMGCDDMVRRKLGTAPDWADVLPPCHEPVPRFLESLHCLLPVNGGAEENWPRVGLEAMAAGVPIVTENKWGWREMIEHGRTGYLADTEDELAYYAGRLAADESHRLWIARNARERLVEELANPDTIWRTWKELFDAVSA